MDSISRDSSPNVHQHLVRIFWLFFPTCNIKANLYKSLNLQFPALRTKLLSKIPAQKSHQFNDEASTGPLRPLIFLVQVPVICLKITICSKRTSTEMQNLPTLPIVRVHLFSLKNSLLSLVGLVGDCGWVAKMRFY